MNTIEKKPHAYRDFLAKEQAAWLLPITQQALRELSQALGLDPSTVLTRKATEQEDRKGIDCWILPTSPISEAISIQCKYIFHPSGNHPLELGCDTPGFTPWALDSSNPSKFTLFINMNNGQWLAVDTQDLVAMCLKSGLQIIMCVGQRAIQNELNGVKWTNYITLLKRDQLIWLLEQHEAFFLTSAENRER
jgi:hypothetical protein